MTRPRAPRPGACGLGRVGRRRVVLFASLFLTWSHQLPKSVLSVAGQLARAPGRARDPTAGRSTRVADVLLALLAAALVSVALVGRSPAARLVVLAAGAIALAFVVHALGTPPTNGVLVLNPVADLAAVPAPGRDGGGGETVALVALALAIVGTLVGLVTSREPERPYAAAYPQRCVPDPSR